MRIAIGMLLLAGVVGCATFETGEDLTIDDATWIEVGQTSAAELPIRLGPASISSMGGMTATAYGSFAAPTAGDYMSWTHTTSSAQALGFLGATSGKTSVVTEQLTVYFDAETGLVSNWRFEGDVNGAWQSLGPGDVPLTEEEIAALRGPEAKKPRKRSGGF